jgi:hypothetical protein
MGASLATIQALLIEKKEKWFTGPPPQVKQPKPVIGTITSI